MLLPRKIEVRNTCMSMHFCHFLWFLKQEIHVDQRYDFLCGCFSFMDLVWMLRLNFLKSKISECESNYWYWLLINWCVIAASHLGIVGIVIPLEQSLSGLSYCYSFLTFQRPVIISELLSWNKTTFKNQGSYDCPAGNDPI